MNDKKRIDVRRLPFAILYLLSSILSVLFAARANAQTTRPDIVLLIADDQSWLNTSFNGDPAVKTPAFDRVAHELASTSRTIIASRHRARRRGQHF